MSNEQQKRNPARDARRRPPNPRHRDNYPHTEKGAQATVCERCGLVLDAGRWQRAAPPPTGASGGLCPACERVRDGYPAGTIRLPGEFLAEREEVLGLIRNAEEAHAAEHPLERLMAVETGAGGGLVVTTTGVHLARRIANKLERRFHRQARFHYSDGDRQLRVEWPEA